MQRGAGVAIPPESNPRWTKSPTLQSPAIACLFGGALSVHAQTTTTYGSGGSSNTYTGGTLIFSRSDASTYSGSLSGTGAVSYFGS